eukprot:snap_masked-scaffold849_size89187-processed-gene-0.13 protein:Tk02984 transcript:snap_masked-scaffold849_size89187-processed-gene-0.13-mRNA-1 annotation:"homologous-pairing protein 2 homolog"
MAGPTEQAVLAYLRAQNRPYSANDIVLNLHKGHGKTAVQKALDLLVADGEVSEKLNGKQKAYVIQQDRMPTASEAELAQLDRDVAEAQAQLQRQQAALQAAELQHRQLLLHPPTERVLGHIARLEPELAALAERIQTLSQESTPVTDEDKARLEARHEAAVKEWRKRKRLCVSITDAILESYAKSPKVLFEDVGIETDEEVGARMPDI